LFLDSGRDTEIIVADQTTAGTKIAKPVEDALVKALCTSKFDVLVLDPVVATHRVSENDNMAIDAVAKTIGRIAGKAHCAAEGVHHVRKTGGNEVTAEDSRGASALVAAARSVRVINRMSEKDAELAGVNSADRRSYFRLEVDKANLAPPSKATWFHLVGLALGNGSNQGIDDQDYVGVAIPWHWPDTFAGISDSDLRAIQNQVAQGRWRENVQAKDWVGKPVAEVINLDITNKAHRARIAALLKTWIKSGALVVVEGEDANREKRSFVEVGMRVNG